jgi:hypothetical protein
MRCQRCWIAPYGRVGFFPEPDRDSTVGDRFWFTSGIRLCQDQTVHPDLQRFVSKRMKAATTEVASSHVPMLSKPDIAL